MSYAETLGAYGSLMVSLGFNPIPDLYQTMSVEELAAYLQQQFQQWEREISLTKADHSLLHQAAAE